LRRKVKLGEFQMQRLDDVLGAAAPALAGRVGLLKIDVEGFEPKVSDCLCILLICWERT
jgi:hypothetical protein